MGAIATQSKDPTIQEGAREGVRLYRYYGEYYTVPIETAARMAGVSVRMIKDVFKLASMGYREKLMAGWTIAQCYAHAGKTDSHRPAPRVRDLAAAEHEIQRLRSLLLNEGIDPDQQ